ncbi:MAG: hypothetical protein A3G97_03645 [Candidatus Rokubacteria bacterium RIFCSPLOWO2_12_FULL_69_21]|nr:MAG: hypothetical protein A3G97_03645 [Candidatus Rokubacteria bacterium RIFCSPLOWO2_12_FULL_69_21]
MVAPPAEDEAVLACLAALEAALAGAGALPDSLADVPPRTLEAALEALAKRRGAEALPLVSAVAERARTKDARKAARRVLYRLEQAGVTLPRAAPKPVVQRGSEKALSAWISAVDGSGARAVWILFEGAFGGWALCALIVNDQAGILEAAGGAISKKRLEGELRSLRESQKLPWVEIPPARATALVAEALALHARLGTEPPTEFSRWRPFFADVQPPGEPEPPQIDDPTLLDHSRELLELPELASWFLDPGDLQSAALELLQARESRLVLSDQQKGEREAAIVERVVDAAFTPEARRLWARRLMEMAWIFDATGREREGRLARATAGALLDGARAPRHLPFARGLAERGLAFASEVTLGRVSAAHVSRTPQRP